MEKTKRKVIYNLLDKLVYVVTVAGEKDETEEQKKTFRVLIHTLLKNALLYGEEQKDIELSIVFMAGVNFDPMPKDTNAISLTLMLLFANSLIAMDFEKADTLLEYMMTKSILEAQWVKSMCSKEEMKAWFKFLVIEKSMTKKEKGKEHPLVALFDMIQKTMEPKGD